MKTEHKLYPLTSFCERDGVELPPCRDIAASELPEPYQRLLVHTRDMTSVLQEFHSQEIHLSKVDLVREKDRVLRRVALLREDGRPVEFGAIDIRLSPFTDMVQGEILACLTPLGAILNHHKIGYTSSPTGFFEIDSNGFIREALSMESPERLYGRINVLRSENDQVIAKVVEILPPLPEDQ